MPARERKKPEKKRFNRGHRGGFQGKSNAGRGVPQGAIVQPQNQTRNQRVRAEGMK